MIVQKIFAVGIIGSCMLLNGADDNNLVDKVEAVRLRILSYYQDEDPLQKKKDVVEKAKNDLTELKKQYEQSGRKSSSINSEIQQTEDTISMFKTKLKAEKIKDIFHKQSINVALSNGLIKKALNIAEKITDETEKDLEMKRILLKQEERNTIKNDLLTTPRKVKTPPLPAKTPLLKAKTPPLPAKTPLMQAKTPPLKAKTPLMQVKTPSMQAKTPPLRLKTLSVQVKTPLTRESTPQPIRVKKTLSEFKRGLGSSAITLCTPSQQSPIQKNTSLINSTLDDEEPSYYISDDSDDEEPLCDYTLDNEELLPLPNNKDSEEQKREEICWSAYLTKKSGIVIVTGISSMGLLLYLSRSKEGNPAKQLLALAQIFEESDPNHQKKARAFLIALDSYLQKQMASMSDEHQTIALMLFELIDFVKDTKLSRDILLKIAHNALKIR